MTEVAVLAAAVALALVLALLAFFPDRTAIVLAFLTAAFPKAGIKVGDFPFPVFLFGLLIALAVFHRNAWKRVVSRSLSSAFLLLAIWVIGRAVIYVGGGATSGAAAFLAWALVPAGIVIFVLTRATRDRRLYIAVQLGFVLSAVYALVQLVLGVEQSAIEGLTYAYGDDLAGKFNTVYTSTGDDYSKIASTYQNGNIYGLIGAVLFAISARAILQRRSTWVDIAVLPAALLAVGLSGSRTAIIAAALAVVVLLTVTAGSGALKVLFVATVGIVAALTVRLQPGLTDRYTLDSIITTGGSGRTDIWQDAIARMSPLDFLIGTLDYRITEGWLGFLMQMGVVGAALFAFFIAALLAERPALRLPALMLLVGLLIDSSYMFFPTWFIIAAIAGSVEAGVRRPVLAPRRARFYDRRYLVRSLR